MADTTIEPNRTLSFQIADHDPVDVVAPIDTSSDADDVLGVGGPAMRKLFAHVELVEFLDGMPIEVHAPRHIGDRHGTTQAANLHGKPQRVFCVGRHKASFSFFTPQSVQVTRRCMRKSR